MSFVDTPRCPGTCSCYAETSDAGPRSPSFCDGFATLLRFQQPTPPRGPAVADGSARSERRLRTAGTMTTLSASAAKIIPARSWPTIISAANSHSVASLFDRRRRTVGPRMSPVLLSSVTDSATPLRLWYAFREQRQEPNRVKYVGFPHTIGTGDACVRPEIQREIHQVFESVDFESGQHNRLPKGRAPGVYAILARAIPASISPSRTRTKAPCCLYGRRVRSAPAGPGKPACRASHPY